MSTFVKKSLKYSVLIGVLLSGTMANAAIISDYTKTTAQADGWTIVYQGGYGASFDYGGFLNSITAGSIVALASSSSDRALTYDLFAGTSLNILQNITNHNATIFADDAYWYRNNESVGFAPNASIYQTSADVVGAGWGYYDNLRDGDLRLSWHGGNPTVDSGWRSGLNIGLNGDNIWQRYVLVKTDVPVPEPASFALLGIGFAGLAATRRRKQKSGSPVDR